MTQNEQVLKHIRTFGCITPSRAQADYGIMRLAARIDDLKTQGYLIETETVRGYNRYGTPTHYAKYSLNGTAIDTDADIGRADKQYCYDEEAGREKEEARQAELFERGQQQW